MAGKVDAASMASQVRVTYSASFGDSGVCTDLCYLIRLLMQVVADTRE